MIPGYRNMDSYPFQRNQIPFPYYHHPSMEPVPPQMTKSPFPCEKSWPYASNYNHPIPPHFCYGHNNYPCYNSHIPSYPPHVPSPSPMYYSGGCPSFFGPYYPQSHYNMELPRYEYDKYMPRDHHCCGCSNHSCSQKEDKSVKVEEQKPDVGKKENDAMVPIQFRNFPFPLAWIPPEYYGNKQPENFKVDEQDKMLHDKRPNADVQPKVEPRMWSGWLPFDVKGDPNMFRDGDGIRSLEKETDSKKEEAENGRMEQKHQSDQKKSEFPFPFFLFPYYNNQEEGGKAKSDDVKFTDRSVSDITEKTNNQRSIPVKQIESNHEKNDLHGSGKREMNDAEENVTKKDSNSMSKRRSTSPPKGSKLPPVCLRVDPLPRKKNGNGSSRSPSPPASKEHLKATSVESKNIPLRDIKDRIEPNSNSKSSSKASKEFTPEVKTIQVCQNKTNDKNKEKGAENKTRDSSEHSVKDRNTTTNEAGKSGRRVLSDADAAVLIQAVYRGYLVRKWEPLKKLRQIGEVSKEVTDVRERVQAFEGHSDFQNDNKQKIAIGETIMRLLLKLDTLQGLHPSLREIRKSLARELVTLQEKLDSISVKIPPQQPHEDAKEPVEVSPLNVQNGEDNQEQQEEKVTSEKDSFGGTSNGSPKEHFCMMDDDGGSEPRSHVDSASSERAKTTMLPNGLINEDYSPVIAADALDSTSNFSDKTDSECKSKSEVSDIPIVVDKLDTTALKESPMGANDDDISDNSASEGLDSDMHALKELPVGVLDEDTATFEGTNTSGNVQSEVHAENEVFIEELPVGVLDEDTALSKETNTSETEVQAGNEVFIEELPVGVLDEDTATSDETDSSESEVQAGNEVFIKELPVGLLDEDPEKFEVEISKHDAKDTQLEQPQVEEKEDVKSSEESDGWVKIEFQKEDDGHIADTQIDTEESGIGIDSKLPPLEISDHGNQEANDLNIIIMNEKEPEEKLAQQETKADVQDTADREPTGTKTKVSADLNGDMRLLEENEKLRKLMKELLEAGNEQISVISNLTGRVQDLEKKLAKTKRSKKVRTKRHKPVTPKMSWSMSCSNSSE